MILQSPWPSVASYPSVPMWELLKSSSRRFPDKIALVEGHGRAWTYGELWAATMAVARFLELHANVAPGERVAITAEGTGDFAAAMFGAFLCGGIVTPLSPLLAAADLEHQLQDSEASIAVVSFRSRLVVDPLRAAGSLPFLRAVYELEGVGALDSTSIAQWHPAVVSEPEDLALLPYTSGTESQRKGSMTTHGEYAMSAYARIRSGGLTSDVVYLDLGPKHATLGWMFAVGATAVEPAGSDADEMLELIEKHKVTHITARPFAIDGIFRAYEQHPRDISSLHFIETSGMPLPTEVAAKGERLLGLHIRQAYGLTETNGPTNRSFQDDIRAGSVGPPLPDVEERIVDQETGLDVAVGEPGELLVRGPQITKGYWRNPEATAQVLLPDGWLRTGDLACSDSDGHVYVLDRLKEIVKVYGRQVPSAEVESALKEHPAVRDVVVIPVPSVAAGEVPKAFVVLRDGSATTAAELTLFVSRRLAPYKAPREIEFVAAIPRGPTGKTLRRVLVDEERARRASPASPH